MRISITLAFLCFCTLLSAQSTQDTLKQSEIEGVVITARKPTVESKVDRTVFNVENSSILAGNTTWDVLRMTPLVSIDNNDVVKSEGENVTVYINDRKSVFTGKELKEYLKSIPADNLMKIEVITNPSSRYETSGQVINIVLKKREDEGVKGSIYMTNTQNRKNNQYSGLNLNYHKGKFTQTITGSYNDYSSVQSDTTESMLYLNNESRRTESNALYHSRMPSFSSTSEWELNDKNNIGIIGEFFQNNSSSEGNSTGEILRNGLPYNQYSVEQQGNSNYRVLSSNIFYKYYDKQKNKIFDVNAGVNYNTHESDRNFLRYQTLPPFMEFQQVMSHTQMRNYYLKLDYSQPLDSAGSTFEAGMKLDFNNNHVPTDYYGFTSQILKNRFSYRDNLNSVYANYSSKFFDYLDVRIGLRYEYMTLTLHQETDNIQREDSYGILMPNVLLKYTFTPNFNLSTSYNYSIWRPWYSEFNPFELPTGDGNYTKGNMDLEPNPNHRFTLKAGIYKKYFISLNYGFTNQDYWDDYIQDGDRLISYPANFPGRSERYSANFNTNQTFFQNKLNVNLNLGLNYIDNSDFNARNGIEAKDYLTNFGGSVNFSYTNLFGKNINLSGWGGLYKQNNGNTQGNTFNFYHNFSVTKIFEKAGLEASLRFNNIFMKPVFDQTTYSQVGTFHTISRSDWYGASFTLVKRFGNQKVKENSKVNAEKNEGGGK